MNRHRIARHRRRAFTLVEMLLVLVILGTLAAIVIPKFAGRTEQAKVTAAETQIANLETALDAFEVDMGYYPEGEQGLEELFNAPSDADGWRGPYLKQGIPTDPWGQEYLYECPGTNNPDGYDLASAGPDKRHGTEDDLTNW